MKCVKCSEEGITDDASFLFQGNSLCCIHYKEVKEAYEAVCDIHYEAIYRMKNLIEKVKLPEEK